VMQLFSKGKNPPFQRTYFLKAEPS
jgi:hypothetical protein